MFFFKKKRRSFDPRSISEAAKVKLARTLRREGGREFAKDKFEDAVHTFQDLIRLEPESAEHRRKLADCYGRLGIKDKEIEARSFAAALYAEQGFLLKAIAMFKMVLVVDPSHQETREKLTDAKRRAGKPVALVSSSPTIPPDEEEDGKAVEVAQARVQAALEVRDQLRSARKNQRSSWIPGSAIEAISPESIPPESILPLSDSDVNFLDLGDMEQASFSNLGLDLKAVLRRTPLFDDLDERMFVKLIDCVEIAEISTGEVLFRQGDPADSMYAIAEGEVQASAGEPELVLATLGEGNFFGEIGLLAEQPRQSTVTATKDTILLRFDREVISEMQQEEPSFTQSLLRFVRERLVMRLTKTSPFFAPFEGSEAHELAQRFQFLEVKDLKPLVQQGLRSDGLFILLTGEARVIRTDSGGSTELRRLGPGDIFGEMSLVTQEQAMASVVTSSKVFALFLPAKDFRDIIMTHPVVLEYVSALAIERQNENQDPARTDEEYIEDQMTLL